MFRHSLPVFFLAAVACGDSMANDTKPAVVQPAKAAASEPAAATSTPSAAPTAEGSITGRIKFNGESRPGAAIDLSPDPFCVEHNGDAGLRSSGIAVGEDGGLADVFVQLTSGVPDEKYDAPDEPVVLDQIGCNYVPHVFGVMKKQDIEIRNSDATLHNIHPTPKRNKEFNLAMPNKGDVRTKNFRKAEEGIAFKCDVHPWMRAWCFVLEHPYFGTTDKDGAFTINAKGLSDGEYGVKVWHEVLGEKEGTVTLAGGKASIELTLEAAEG